MLKQKTAVFVTSLVTVALPLLAFNPSGDPEWNDPNWNSPTSAQSSGLEGSYLPQNYNNPNSYPGGMSSDKSKNDPFGDGSFGPPPSGNQNGDSDFGPPQ